MEGLVMTLGILLRLAAPLGLLALISTSLRHWDAHRIQ